MSVTILTGDCRQTLLTVPEKSVQCCVTSPPYFGLRDYKVAGQIGLEQTPEEYVREMVSVFGAVRRTLRDNGVLWLNLGDSYCSVGGRYEGRHDNQTGVGAARAWREGAARADGELRGDGASRRNRNGTSAPGVKTKDLIGIPWRVAFALQADGWYLRAACPWIKRNGMPDSTQDRPTQCIETVFMLTKNKTCYYDAEAVKVRAKSGAKGSRFDTGKTVGPHEGTVSTRPRKEDGKRLRRTSDWFFESWQGLLLDENDDPAAFVVNLKGYKEAHFATFPSALIEPCILSSTSAHGCCVACGSSYERQTEHTPMVIDRSERTHEMGRMRSSGTQVSPAVTVTTGWSKTCTCAEAPPFPA